MLDPRQLYTTDADLLASLGGSRPALLHLLDGYIDAGYDFFIHSLATPKGLKHYQDITAAHLAVAAGSDRS